MSVSEGQPALTPELERLHNLWTEALHEVTTLEVELAREREARQQEREHFRRGYYEMLDRAEKAERRVRDLQEALREIMDDALTLLDQHVSPEVELEARRKLIERFQAGEALVGLPE